MIPFSIKRKCCYCIKMDEETLSEYHEAIKSVF